MTHTYNTEGSGEVHLDVLKAICGDTSGKFLCDLGCGFAAQTRQLGFAKKHFVDSVIRDLAEENENFIHNSIENHICNLAGFHRYEVITMLDSIEHFNKKEALIILNCIEGFSKSQIIFTPLGSYLVEEIETPNSKFPDAHRSGWLPKEFEDMGWATIVFPEFHKLLNIGAFFAFHCENQDSEFERIINELNQKEWAMTEDELRQKAIKMGYVHGAVINSDHFGEPLRIGFGLVWSDFQQALVIGCTNYNNEYFTAVPVYERKLNKWTEIIKPNE